MSFSPDAGRSVSLTEVVTRSFCPDCGSPLTGRYAYLPGTVYVPVGLLDGAEGFPPEMHAHHDNRLCWLSLKDSLPKHAGSARSSLNDT